MTRLALLVMPVCLMLHALSTERAWNINTELEAAQLAQHPLPGDHRNVLVNPQHYKPRKLQY